MSHYNVSYKDDTNENLDKKALADTLDYLGEDRMKIFVAMAEHEATTIEEMNFYFGFAGVQGRPVHAFFRKYMLAKYLAWMRSGDDAQIMDDQGYHVITEETNNEPKKEATQ